MDGSLFPLLFVVLLGVAFWVLVIRPARTRAQDQARLVASLRPGARVLLASGMVGEVVALHEEDCEVLIAPGVVVTFLKQAVLREVEPAAAGTPDVEPHVEPESGAPAG